VKLATSSRLAQAQELVATYPEVKLFLPALVDFDRWTGNRGSSEGRTRARSSPQEQIPTLERLSKLAILGKLGRAPVSLHGMVAFDPRREAEDRAGTYEAGAPEPEDVPLIAPSGDWARRTVDTRVLPGSYLPMRHALEHGGFVGVKLYPPVGFQPLGNGALEHLQAGGLGLRIDRVLHRFYAYCEREEVPLLVHMGTSNAFDRDFRFYAHPRNWAPVLERYPKLRVNFGHFGHVDGVTGSGNYEQAWASIAAELMERHESVYADLGNVDIAAEPEVVKLLQHLLGRYRKLPTRLLYGSDWYMNSLQGIRTVFYQDMLGVIARDLSSAGPGFVEDFAGRNTLRFLGLLNEDGTRRDGKLRQRLKRFYAGQGEPDWLK
jgi:predicted TIM-barrel fold metal-dependent hydrolase